MLSFVALLAASSLIHAAPGEAVVREAKAVVPVGFVRMEVATVMPTGDSHTVLLVNTDAEVLLPVGVALPEAVTIYGRLENKKSPRPVTHDLLDGVVSALDGRVLRVQIDDLVDGAFIGTVVLQSKKGGQPFAVDARAADALALALSASAPIYVAKSVMDRAGLTHDDLKRMPSASAPPLPAEAAASLKVFDL